jgi:glycogen synthase
VAFRGVIEQTELIRGLSQYDVFAFPTAWREPFGFAPLEAAAAGCVPLISDTSGIAEWMVGGVHSLKAPRTASAFAEVLRSILHGEIDLAPIARRGQTLVRDAFHLPILLPIIESTLEQAAGQPVKHADDRLLRAAAHAARTLLV